MRSELGVLTDTLILKESGTNFLKSFEVFIMDISQLQLQALYIAL